MHGTIVPYGSIETADGFIDLTVGNDANGKNFAAASTLRISPRMPAF